MPFKDSRGEEFAMKGEAPHSTGGAGCCGLLLLRLLRAAAAGCCCCRLRQTDRRMAVPGSAQLSEAALESWQPEPVDADPTTAGTSARCLK